MNKTAYRGQQAAYRGHQLYQVYRALRPYVFRLLGDFIVASTLWVSLYALKFFIGLLDLKGWPLKSVEYIHATGVLVVFAIFCVNILTGILFAARGASSDKDDATETSSATQGENAG